MSSPHIARVPRVPIEACTRVDLCAVTAALDALLAAVVAREAKWLPVSLSPEQRLIAPMRGDVIDHGRDRRAASGFAHGAERVLHEEVLRPKPPSMPIAALACRGPRRHASLLPQEAQETRVGTPTKSPKTLNKPPNERLGDRQLNG